MNQIINKILVNIPQPDDILSVSRKQNARQNIDAQIRTVSAEDSKVVISDVMDLSGTYVIGSNIAMESTPFSVVYPLTLYINNTAVNLGMDVSKLMDRTTYNSLQDMLTVGNNIIIQNNTISKVNTVIDADDNSGLSVTGTANLLTLSLNIASSSKIGGVIIGNDSSTASKRSYLAINDNGYLYCTTIKSSVSTETGRGRESNACVEISSRDPYIQAAIPAVDILTIIISGTQRNLYTVNGGFYPGFGFTTVNKPLISYVGHNESQNPDLSVKTTYINSTLGMDSEGYLKYIIFPEGSEPGYGVPAECTASVAPEQGHFMYLDGQLKASTLNLGDESTLIEFDTDGFKLYNNYSNMTPYYPISMYDGDLKSIVNDNLYCVTVSTIGSHSIERTGRSNNYIWESISNVIDESWINRCLNNGITNFEFIYDGVEWYKWTAMSYDELIPININNLQYGVTYTVSFNFGDITYIPTSGTPVSSYLSNFSMNRGFGLSFIVDFDTESNVKAEYYGFMHGAAMVKNNTYYTAQDSSAYKVCFSNSDEPKLTSPMRNSNSIDTDNPYGDTGKLITTTTITNNDNAVETVYLYKSQNYVIQTTNIMNWYSILHQGNPSSDVCGPLHSVTFMRGADHGKIPTIYLVSYS